MATTRNEKSARNMVYVIFKQVFLLFLNFLAKTVFVHFMGKEFLGLNGIFNNIFLLFSFAEFGMGTAMIYSFYEPLATGDKEKCAALYQYFKKLYYGMSLFLIVAGLVIIPLLPWIIDLDMNLGNIIIYYLFYMVSTFISNLFLYKSNLLIADQNQYLVSRILLIIESLCFILQIIVIWRWQNYILYLMVLVLKTMGIGLLYSKEVKKHYPHVLVKVDPLSKEQKKPIIENTKTLFIYKFTKVLINSTDNLIISIIVGTVWVGMYSSYELVITGIWALVTAFFSAISASVGNLIVEKDREDQFRIYQVIDMMNTWIAGFTSICLFILFQDFISLWIGDSYHLEIVVMGFIVVNYYLRCMREGISMFREAAGIFKKFKNVTLATAIINIILSFILGAFWGMAGIFGATIISVLITYFWYEPYLVYKDLFHKPIGSYFKRQCINIMFTVIILVVVQFLCNQILISGIWGFILKILICGILINVFYLIYFYKTKEFKILWNIGMGFLKRDKRKESK